ncbi:MAG: hypothetical protein QOC58_1314, partial [Mycobacterium sp.]|nr:hypothetical protein [Mycobacterium sp.]
MGDSAFERGVHAEIARLAREVHDSNSVKPTVE